MAKLRNLRIKPYARLLTMLGEQLIKNERIALMELLKNSYDADAAWVKISFQNFESNYKVTSSSKIIIEDNGHGMDSTIIEKHWLNPATPEKLNRKLGKNGSTKKGRVLQGEKGIGRFAILKLGRKIKITTRAKGDKEEHVIRYDFSKYDDEFLTENNIKKELFLEDLSVSLATHPPKEIKGQGTLLGTRRMKGVPYGTKIEISNLKGTWSESKVRKVYDNIARLQSIFPGGEKVGSKNGFEVFIYRGEEVAHFGEDYAETLSGLLKNNSVIKIIDGKYDEKKTQFRFKLNGKPKLLELEDQEITGMAVYRRHFGSYGSNLKNRKTACGDFNFIFYIFDFSSEALAKFQLDKDDKEIIRDHRIYLYRDGIRVNPYGDRDDDWLQIDSYRGTIAAGHFLSNDQVVGCVNITRKENPDLKDKTNREGLIEYENATDDFIGLIKVFLGHIRIKEYARYREGLKDKKAQNIFKKESVEKSFTLLKKSIISNKKAITILSKAEKEYKAEKKYLIRRAETTEELAGVGLSVETASHDIMAIMHKASISLNELIRDSMHGDIDEKELQKELESLRGMLSFIENQLKDIQLLFKSSKQRRKNIKVRDLVDKVESIYRRFLKKGKIDFQIYETKVPLVAKTTDAVLLQLLINLFDNALYWLQETSKKDKKIELNLDGDNGQLIFSDNGPGVSKDDAPYIFEPFYSGKGEDGRGLGLYIARQLLERSDYSIELADTKLDKRLSGANFVISFVSEES